MRNTERIRKLKEWTVRELCEGREMKAPGENMKVTQIVTAEPKCYIAWAPQKLDRAGNLQEAPASTAPSILIMPNQSYAAYVEEKRFDRYNNIHRPKQMGQQLGMTFLFTVYEPGTRMPGFVQSAGERGKGVDTDLMLEGTEQGFFTLMNWMDDCMEKLLGTKCIPKTDLLVQEETMTYSLYTDQNYVVDRRPLYYGFVNVVFGCYVNEEVSYEIEKLL